VLVLALIDDIYSEINLNKSLQMIPGGVADKMGNGYEAYWTLVEAIGVLRGQAEEIRLEPFNENARGFEFRISGSGQIAWHQCKRRLVSGTWTMNALASEGIFKDFAVKLGSPETKCVFISIDPATDFKALIDKAKLVQTSKDFVDALSQRDSRAHKQLVEAWEVDLETEVNWLRRCSVETVSEHSIRRELESVCGLIFNADPNIAIERLRAFIDDQVTRAITTEEFRVAAGELELGWRAHLDPTVDQRINDATSAYLESLPPRIAGSHIETVSLQEISKIAFVPENKLVVVTGAAGGGKSVALERIINAARSEAYPVLALRVDRFLSAQSIEELGKSLLSREESPVGVLGIGTWIVIASSSSIR